VIHSRLAERYGADQHGHAAARQGEPLAAACAAEALAVPAQLDDPAPVVAGGRVRGREVQLQRGAVGAGRRQRGGQRRRLVDDEEVTPSQVVGEMTKPGVRERRAVARDHQPHRVARAAARLGRLGRFERGRQRKGERAVHAGVSASERAA